ncbi:hypothetical protein MMC07_008126 [Pseudocyphellaria aurata]|nr:hypothetical protein [Pseudocyphellaria aurata]
MSDRNLVAKLQNHLNELRENPSLPLDQKLLETFTDHITELLSDDDRDKILSSCSDLVPVLQQESAPVLDLVNALIRSESFTFSRVLAIKPAVEFEAGLSSPIASFNLSALTLLLKATHNKSDADVVAGRPELVAAVIKLWLRTPETGVSEKAQNVLLGLLRASKQGSSHFTSFHQSLMWRRVFRDRDMYGLIFSICSLKTLGQPDQPNKRAKTIAQGRLFDFLVELVDSEPVRSSQLPEIEAEYGVEDGGLLKFAAVYMVDYADDPLMHVTLIDFFKNLLQTRSSAALDFLTENGLHDSTTSYYTDVEDVSGQLLPTIYPHAADYISVYCSKFAAHFLSNRHFVDQLLRSLNGVAEAAVTIPQRYGFPPHDLKILASLPRAVLLPINSNLTPLFAINPDSRDANIYKVLASIFRGSSHLDIGDRQRLNENAAARALYFLYITKVPLLWKSVCRDAQAVALKELALAASELISAVISANWEPLSTEITRSSPEWPALLTEEELALACGSAGKEMPSSGVLAILDSHLSQEVVTYLCNAATSSRSLVGGRGDIESAAYQVATAKYDVMSLFRQKLKDVVQARPKLQNILTKLEKTLAQGPNGGSSDVGGRIDTLEL